PGATIRARCRMDQRRRDRSCRSKGVGSRGRVPASYAQERARRPSGGCRAVSEELEEVMGQAEERPLAADFLDPAKGEAPETPCLLDLAEGGLDDCLTPGVGRLACRRG